MLSFRKLLAEEIECRVSQIVEGKKNNGVILLLYKDARCDMRILDETVGPMNWQRDHKEIKGNMYCGVGIWDGEKQQWIWKWDCGTESYTEAQKGEASDSFKRACFNWNLGRELYTAPFIWINEGDCKIVTGKNGKLACYDRFKVTDIMYDGNNICGLTIKNEKTNRVVYQWGNTIKDAGWTQQPETTQKASNKLVDSVSTENGNSGWQREKEPENDYDKAVKEYKERCQAYGVGTVDILKAAGWAGGRKKATLEEIARAHVILDERFGVQS